MSADEQIENMDVQTCGFSPRLNLYVDFCLAADPDNPNHQFCVTARYTPDDQPVFTEYFPDDSAAMRTFSAITKGQRAYEDLRPDDLISASRVYGWEDAYLSEYSAPLTKNEALAMIAIICADYEITPPKLQWVEEGQKSFAIGSRRIEFSHRDTLTLLHEMAHIILAAFQQEDQAEAAPHGPLFVNTAMELYHRYAGFDMGYMTATAFQSGILGDLAHTISERYETLGPHFTIEG